MLKSAERNDPDQREKRPKKPQLLGNSMPLYGLISTVFGTTAAITLIPENHLLPGALFLSGVAQSLGLLLPIIWVGCKQPMSLFRADYLLFPGLVYWLLMDLLQGINEPQNLTRSAVQLAFISIGLFAASIWIGTAIRAVQLPKMIAWAASSELSPGRIFTAIVVCFGLTMFNYLAGSNFDPELMIMSLGESRWSAPWAARQLGGWESFRTHLIYFGYMLPALTVLLAKKIGWFSPGTIASVLFSVICLVFASQSGNRSEVGVIFGAAILCWVVIQPRFSMRVVLRGALAAAVLLIWMQVMLAFRGQGLSNFFSDPEAIASTEMRHVAVDDNFYRLCQVMDIFPERVDFVYGGQLLYVLVRPIPRAIWPEKPTSPGFLFHELTDVRGASLSVSIIGELYFDFGLTFVFVGGLIYGVLAAMWCHLLDRREGSVWPLLYGLGTMALFAGIRSEQAFIVRVYPILFWLVVHSVFLIEWKRPSRARMHGAVPSET